MNLGKDENIIQLWAHPKDQNYKELVSQHNLMDVLALAEYKFHHMKVPETVMLDSGDVMYWIFNSKKELNSPVIKHPVAKLKIHEVLKLFDQRMNESQHEYKNGKKLSDRSSTVPIAVMKYVDGRVITVTYNQLKDLIYDGSNELRVVQEYIRTRNKSDNHQNETIYCEMRLDDEANAEPAFKFCKKQREIDHHSSQNYVSKFFKKIESSKEIENRKNNSPSKDSANQEARVRLGIVKKNQNLYFKLREQHICDKLKRLTVLVAEHISKAIEGTVRKIICKFLNDESDQYILIGIKQLFFTSNSGYRRERVKVEEIFDVSNRIHRPMIDVVEKKKVDKYIGKLQKCQGDFCNLISLDSLIHDNVIDDPLLAKTRPDDDLPYTIPSNLYRLCHTNKSEVSKILRKSKVFPKSMADLFKDNAFMAEFNDIEYDFDKTDVDQINLMYRDLKVCNNCYPIYMIIQRTFSLKDVKEGYKHRIKANERQEKFNREALQKANDDLLSLRSSLNLKKSLPKLTKAGLSKRTADSFLSSDSLKLNQSLEGKIDAKQLFTVDTKQVIMQRMVMGLSTKSEIEQNLENLENREPSIIKNELGPKEHVSIFQIYAELGTASINNISKNYVKGRPRVTLLQNSIGAKKQKRRFTVKADLSNNLKKRKSHFEDLVIHELPKLPMTSLIHLAYFFNIHSVVFEAKRLIQKRRNQSIEIETPANSVYHSKNVMSIRDIPPYFTSTKKTKLNLTYGISGNPNLSFNDILRLGNYTYSGDHSDQIRAMIIDEYTAIPFSIIYSKDAGFKCYDVIIICHDLFSDYIEKLEYYTNLSNQAKNLKFILFNIPGQAFTLYHEQNIYNNDYNSKILDHILCDLIDKEEINPSNDLFKFVGAGYGANIILYFLANSMEGLFSRSYTMLINPFMEIDKIIESNFKKAIEVFQEIPDNLPETSFFFYNITFGNGAMTKEEVLLQMSVNQISPKARVTILRGALESFSIKKVISSIPTPLIIVQTLENLISGSDNVYGLCYYKDTVITEIESVSEFLMNPLAKRTVVECRGSYNCFEEREKEVIDLCESFFFSDQRTSKLVEWIFHEKLLSKLENEINDFFEVEIPESDKYIEKLEKIKKYPKEEADEIVDEAEGFLKSFTYRLNLLGEQIENAEETLEHLVEGAMKKINNNEITHDDYYKVKKPHKKRMKILREIYEKILSQKQKPLNIFIIISKRNAGIENNFTKALKLYHDKTLEKAVEKFSRFTPEKDFKLSYIKEAIAIKNECFSLWNHGYEEIIGFNEEIIDLNKLNQDSHYTGMIKESLYYLQEKTIDFEINLCKQRIKLADLIQSLFNYIKDVDIQTCDDPEVAIPYLKTYFDQCKSYHELIDEKLSLTLTNIQAERFENAMYLINEIFKAFKENHNNTKLMAMLNHLQKLSDDYEMKYSTNFTENQQNGFDAHKAILKHLISDCTA